MHISSLHLTYNSSPLEKAMKIELVVLPGQAAPASLASRVAPAPAGAAASTPSAPQRLVVPDLRIGSELNVVCVQQGWSQDPSRYKGWKEKGK